MIQAYAKNVFSGQADFSHFNLEYNFTLRQVSILLEAENQTEIKLILSYVVSNASWTPLYDLRAFTKDNTLQVRKVIYLLGF